MTDCIIGADLSLLKRIRDRGDRYAVDGRPVPDVAGLFRDMGYMWARLRLFNEPSGHGAQCNDLPYTLALAAELAQKGFKWLLDFHYSDGWADPAKQYPPRAWANMDFDTLEETVHAYTRDIVREFMRVGAEPDMVQVGNEVSPGMLWPHGQVAAPHGADTVEWERMPEADRSAAWGRFGRLLKAGVQGVYDATGKKTPIMIHIDRGGDLGANEWFFDHLCEQDVPFDAIGESYYPFWQGPPEKLAATMDFLERRYGKDIYLAEVAYPHKPHPMYHAGLLGGEAPWKALLERFPLSPEGQQRALEEIASIVRANPRGRGWFYWAPEWIPPQQPGVEDEPDAPGCWTRALFDEKGRALPALATFKPNPL